MKKRRFDDPTALYRPDRPLLVRSETTLRQQLVRCAHGRRLIVDSANRTRAVEALGPFRRACALFN